MRWDGDRNTYHRGRIYIYVHTVRPFFTCPRIPDTVLILAPSNLATSKGLLNIPLIKAVFLNIFSGIPVNFNFFTMVNDWFNSRTTPVALTRKPGYRFGWGRERKFKKQRRKIRRTRRLVGRTNNKYNEMDRYIDRLIIEWNYQSIGHRLESEDTGIGWCNGTYGIWYFNSRYSG